MKRTTKTSVAVLLMAAIIAAQPSLVWAQTNDSSTATTVAAESNPAAQSAGTEGAKDSSAPSVEQPAKNRRGPVLGFLSNVTGPVGHMSDSVIAIGGSAKANGQVREAVVAIGGDATALGDVGDAVVAVGGDASARGKVGDAVVAVAGNAEVNGEVGDAVVAVMGNVRLGSNAVVNGDVVAVGGKVELADGAQVNGEIKEISVAQYPLLMPLKGAADWLRHCGLKFRLLAPQPGWYWVVVLIFLSLYALIAAAARRPVNGCVKELTNRPATTFLMGLLVKILLPIVVLVLAATGIGAVVVPFVLAAVFIGGLIGKVALFEFMGGKMLKMFGVTVARPVLALPVGFALVTLLYMLPVISLLIYFLLGLWAIGVAMMAVFSAMNRESPPRQTPPPSAPGMPHMAATNFTGQATGDASGAASGGIPPVSSVSAGTNMPEAYTLQRANFWERIAAAFLDVIIVGILITLVVHIVPPLRSVRPPQIISLVALAYFAGMWTWKGTTIGGTVLNLKVVRLDGQPVTFAVALVRGFMSALSAMVFCLGFLWMIWDRDRQTWHDKIAGTVVVRTPRVVPLVCL